MSGLNERRAQAVVNLEQNADFQEVMGFLRELKQRHIGLLIYSAENTLATQRGVVRGLTEVVDDFETARETLNKYRR